MPNVTISLDKVTLKAAKTVAEKEFRSLSQHVAFLLQKDTEQKSAAENQRRRKSSKVPA